MKFVPYAQVRKVQKSNPAAWWHKATPEGAEADRTTAAYRYSQKFFGPALARPKFQIGRDERFFMMGSCFARGLESALANRKFKVLSRTDRLDRFATGGIGSALGKSVE